MKISMQIATELFASIFGKGKQTMVNEKKYRLNILILGLFFWIQPAFANWKVDQRPQTLSIGKELTFRYETVRGEIENPADGINVRLAKLHSNLKLWITNCAQLKLRVDSAIGTNLSAFESQLIIDAQQSAKQFDNIYAEVLDIQTKLQVLIQSLHTARRINYEMTAYQTEYQTLVSAVDNLEQNLKITESRISDLVSDIRSSIPQLNSALLARLKLNLIGQGLTDIDTSISSAEKLLATDKFLDNLTKNFKVDVKRFNKFVLEARYFSVLDLGQKLQGDCSDLTLKVVRYAGHEKVKDSYLKMVQSLCSSIDSDVSAFTNESPGEIVASSIRDLRLDRLKTRCSATNPGVARCSMLSWLGKLSSDQITTMDVGTLRGLESLWDEAEGEKEVTP